VLAGFPPEPTASPDSAARTVAIIPARYESSRFPGKPLAVIAGRPMIEYVYRRVSESSVDLVLVATDDARIADAVRGFGGRAVMTSSAHRSGTDRLAEVARTLACDVVVNVQGDEPLIEPELIDRALEPLADTALQMSTVRRMARIEELNDPNVVKVVVDRDGFALYFSRAAIPYRREARRDTPATPTWAHIGLYVYRRTCLLQLASLLPTPLEQSEMLEQLRALEHGVRIATVETTIETVGVDTPEDLERVRARLEGGTVRAR
jgi:3-deoxy-manno-octulosonate cytidylyltransferase (CMP-KDO synthetase)